MECVSVGEGLIYSIRWNTASRLRDLKLFKSVMGVLRRDGNFQTFHTSNYFFYSSHNCFYKKTNLGINNFSNTSYLLTHCTTHTALFYLSRNEIAKVKFARRTLTLYFQLEDKINAQRQSNIGAETGSHLLGEGYLIIVLSNGFKWKETGKI